VAQQKGKPKKMSPTFIWVVLTEDKWMVEE